MTTPTALDPLDPLGVEFRLADEDLSDKERRLVAARAEVRHLEGCRQRAATRYDLAVQALYEAGGADAVLAAGAQVRTRETLIAIGRAAETAKGET